MNSWKLSLLAISLLLLFSLTFAPWAAFEPIRPDPDGLFDMEVVAWSARFKTMATFWGIEAAATIASLPITLVLGKRNRQKDLVRGKRTDADSSEVATTTRLNILRGCLLPLLLAAGSLVLGYLITFGFSDQGGTEGIGIVGPAYGSDGSVLDPNLTLDFQSGLPSTLVLVDSEGHQLLRHRTPAGKWTFVIRAYPKTPACFKAV